MSIPLLINQESKISDYNLDITKKFSLNTENLDEKNKLIHNSDINSLITREIYFFKDEILKEINDINDKLIIRIASNFQEINEKLIKNEESFKLINDKFDEIYAKNVKYDEYDNKINSLFEFKIKNENELLSHLTMMNRIKNEMKDGFLEYNYILKKYKSNDELVGERRKFKTFPELIKFLYQNISQFNTLQEKNNLDFKGYKAKLDSTINSFKNQINTIITSMKTFTTNSVKDSERKTRGLISLFDDRLVEIRSELSKNTQNLKEETEKNLNQEKAKIKEELNKKLEVGLLNINDTLRKTQKKLEENLLDYNKNFLKLKKDFDDYTMKEDRFYELFKMQKFTIENNSSNNTLNNINNNINNINNMNNFNNNQDKINLRAQTGKSKTQRSIFKSANSYNNLNNIFNNSSASHLDKFKRNFLFNSSGIKEVRENIKEIKNNRQGKQIEISNNNYEKQINDQSIEKSPKKLVFNNNKAIIKDNNNNNTNILRIKKVTKHKTQINYSAHIKDNNNREEVTIRTMKNNNEIKDNELPKLIEVKKDDNNLCNDIKLNTDRSDVKNKTTISFTRSNNKNKFKRVLSNIKYNLKNENVQRNNPPQYNLDLSNTFKIFKETGESKLNHKVSIYDVKFKPYKDYDRNKVLKNEEEKQAAKNANENNNDKKANTINNKKEEYNYINSKGELSNIIEIPPPEDVIHKSIFGVE